MYYVDAVYYIKSYYYNTILIYDRNQDFTNLRRFRIRWYMNPTQVLSRKSIARKGVFPEDVAVAAVAAVS